MFNHSSGLPANEACPEGVGLIVFDLDGTILDNGLPPTQRVIDAFVQAKDKGCQLAVCSGRPLSMVPEPIRHLDSLDYLITSNGASVVRAGQETVVVHHAMSRAFALGVIEALSPVHPSFACFVTSHGYWEKPSYMSMIRQFNRREVLVSELDDPDVVKPGGCSMVDSIMPLFDGALDYADKFEIHCDTPDLCDQALEILRGLDTVDVSRGTPFNLEVSSKGVNKGSGVIDLERGLGVSRQRTVAFGDGGNDLSMCPSVGCFVAMGNALDSVKELATTTCPAVSEDGVAVWLEAAMAGEELPRG